MRVLFLWLSVIVAVFENGSPTTAATVVVASKDSLHKERADFTCDGVDDHVEIQQAIDAIPAVGGMVMLLEGTFLFGDGVEITKDNVTIRGMGRSTILRHLPTRWIKLTKDAKVGEESIEVADTAQFRLGQLIGISDEVINPRKEAGERYAYYNNYFMTSYFHLVTGISGDTITLDRPLKGDVLVAKNARMAPGWVMIKAYGKENLALHDFAIDGNRQNVARIFAGYSHFVPPPGYPWKPSSPPPTIFPEVHHGEEPTSAIYMENAHRSRFTNLYLHDIPMSGLFLFSSNHVLVEGNTIMDYGLKGYVNCFGSHTRIIGNEISNSLHEDGINVYDVPSSFSIVSNNLVRNCRRACITINQARRAVVSGNNVSHDPEGPYRGTGISVVSREASVSGNYVEGSVIGITVAAMKDFWADPVSDYPITVTGNTVRNCGTGVRIIEASQVNISGNSIAQAAGTTALASSGNPAGEGLAICNNQFLGSGSKDCVAIRLQGRRDLIMGNVIRNFSEGIRLESTNHGSIVENNQFIGVAHTFHQKGTGN